MKRLHTIRLLLALALPVAAWGFTDAGKNLAPVIWTTLPADAAGAIRAIPAEAWNFGFRHYGATSDQLWTDPALQRGAVEGAGGGRTTALAATCDADGFTFLILCSEPSLTNWLERSQSFPSPVIEFYFAPGDADKPAIVEHFMGVYDGPGHFTEYSGTVPGPRCRRMLPYLTCGEQVHGNAILVRLHYDWAGVFDRLPVFTGRDGDFRTFRCDNFWRVSAIRWADGGLTWGGAVHQVNQAGYIRWPEFTAERKSAILKGVLLKGWATYRKEADSFAVAMGKPPADKEDAVGKAGFPMPDPAIYHAEKVAAEPRTYVNYSEDPLFRPTLHRLLAERDALAPQIAAFDSMAPAEQETFYHKASEMLFNFHYALERAYGEYQTTLLVEGK